MTNTVFSVIGSYEEIFSLLSEEGTKIIAGGTDILLAIQELTQENIQFIDISSFEKINFIQRREKNIEIGATTTHAQIAKSKLLNKYAPALVSACSQIGDEQIRKRGTIGGNIANGSPAADSALPLIAAKAKIFIRNEFEQKEMELDKFYRIRGGVLLKPYDLITKFCFPIPEGKWAAGFIKVGQRSAKSLSIVSAAVQVQLDMNNKFLSAVIAIGSVGAAPIRAKSAEILLKGKPISLAVIQKAAASIQKELSPITDEQSSADERRKTAQETVERLLMDCAVEASKKESKKPRISGEDFNP